MPSAPKTSQSGDQQNEKAPRRDDVIDDGLDGAGLESAFPQSRAANKWTEGRCDSAQRPYSSKSILTVSNSVPKSRTAAALLPAPRTCRASQSCRARGSSSWKICAL